MAEDTVRLGGMALQNGVLVHGPTSWGCAVRGDDGALHVASGRKPHLAPAARQRMPILRGPDRASPRRSRCCRRCGARFRRRASRSSDRACSPRFSAPRSRRGRCAARGCRPGRGRSPLPASRSCPPRSHCAGRTSPPTTAPSTSRSGRTRTAASPRRRSIRAAARSSSRRWSRRRSQRTSSRRRRRPARAASLGSSGRPARSAAPSRSSRGLRATREHPLARVLARPGFELQRHLSTAEPSDDQLEVANAARDACLALERQRA